MSRLADLSDPSVYKLKRSGRPAGRGGIGRNTTRVGHVCQPPAPPSGPALALSGRRPGWRPGPRGPPPRSGATRHAEAPLRAVVAAGPGRHSRHVRVARSDR